jgi:hypothetical protein
MTKDYTDKLIELAEEIHELQLKETSKISGEIKIDFNSIRLTSKINYLIGYILALQNI